MQETSVALDCTNWDAKLHWDESLKVTSVENLQEGDLIAFCECEKKVLARVESIPRNHVRPLIVYKIYGVGSIGVLNIKKKTVLKLQGQV